MSKTRSKSNIQDDINNSTTQLPPPPSSNYSTSRQISPESSPTNLAERFNSRIIANNENSLFVEEILNTFKTLNREAQEEKILELFTDYTKQQEIPEFVDIYISAYFTKLTNEGKLQFIRRLLVTGRRFGSDDNLRYS